MITRLKGATVYDPVHHADGEVRDLYMESGRMVEVAGESARIGRDVDLSGKVVMAGAIDMHTHIGGGKVNIARMMLPERGGALPGTQYTAPGCGGHAPATLTTGYRYAQMGYTACFEPALLPANARQAHMEMADTPIVDTGAYALLGNDDYLLGLLRDGADQQAVNDYVAWTLDATQCIGVKVVNPGGINAFKFNQRQLDVDEQGEHYGVRPRDIVRVLTRALHELGVPHPLHVHASNLGVPGNFESTLATMGAAEGRPVHLTHVQFHSYGAEGKRGFSSAAAQIAEAVNARSHVSVDVGQIMFGQTVTLSGDTMSQFRNRGLASPRKSVFMDIECDAGCGVVPFRYRDRNFVNALQWAIGLELFLSIDDPWRVFLTTDHPNGAPFTSYPHLIRLLMDRTFRNERLEAIHPGAAKHSHLGALDREYSLNEIAIMTRAGPARLLGLADRGHLGRGAVADITVYDPHADRERMFERPHSVYKDGELVVEHGELSAVTQGRTLAVKPDYDAGVERRLAAHFERYHTVRLANFKISQDEMVDHIGSEVVVQPCRDGVT
ncbi:MAG: formylmethanofuran dehydrogenase subunit A [Gammaproteobacteria bacterium]